MSAVVNTMDGSECFFCEKELALNDTFYWNTSEDKVYCSRHCKLNADAIARSSNSELASSVNEYMATRSPNDLSKEDKFEFYHAKFSAALLVKRCVEEEEIEEEEEEERNSSSLELRTPSSLSTIEDTMETVVEKQEEIDEEEEEFDYSTDPELVETEEKVLKRKCPDAPKKPKHYLPPNVKKLKIGSSTWETHGVTTRGFVDITVGKDNVPERMQTR